MPSAEAGGGIDLPDTLLHRGCLARLADRPVVLRLGVRVAGADAVFGAPVHQLSCLYKVRGRTGPAPGRPLMRPRGPFGPSPKRDFATKPHRADPGPGRHLASGATPEPAP